MILASNWEAAGVVVAAVALVVSVFAIALQQRQATKQAALQDRLGKIEIERREEEEAASERERLAQLAADVRVKGWHVVTTMESDKVRLTVENRGPAIAREIEVAIKTTADRVSSLG